MRGRRKSIEEHQLAGTYRADRHGPLTPDDEPAAAPPPMPPGLPDDAAAKWAELVAVLAGRLKRPDVPMLENLARWMAEADKLSAVRAEMKPGDKGYAQNLTMYAIATDKIALHSTRFGMTPADRAKLRAEVATGPAKPKVATRPRTALDAKGKAG